MFKSRLSALVLIVSLMITLFLTVNTFFGKSYYKFKQDHLSFKIEEQNGWKSKYINENNSLGIEKEDTNTLVSFEIISLTAEEREKRESIIPTLYGIGEDVANIKNYELLGKINNIEIYYLKEDLNKLKPQIKLYGLYNGYFSPVFFDEKNIFWNIIINFSEEDIKSKANMKFILDDISDAIKSLEISSSK